MGETKSKVEYFPNLASDSTGTEANGVVQAELEAAGVSEIVVVANKRSGEVPTSIIASHRMWDFRRAWAYWVCSGPGIPPDDAERLHEQFGREVRVAGHCGCPSPTEWFCGFAVGSYHVDTPRGLKALVAMLDSIYRPGGAKEVKPPENYDDQSVSQDSK